MLLLHTRGAGQAKAAAERGKCCPKLRLAKAPLQREQGCSAHDPALGPCLSQEPWPCPRLGMLISLLLRVFCGLRVGFKIIFTFFYFFKNQAKFCTRAVVLITSAGTWASDALATPGQSAARRVHQDHSDISGEAMHALGKTPFGLRFRLGVQKPGAGHTWVFCCLNCVSEWPSRNRGQNVKSRPKPTISRPYEQRSKVRPLGVWDCGGLCDPVSPAELGHLWGQIL